MTRDTSTINHITIQDYAINFQAGSDLDKRLEDLRRLALPDVEIGTDNPFGGGRVDVRHARVGPLLGTYIVFGKSVWKAFLKFFDAVIDICGTYFKGSRRIMDVIVTRQQHLMRLNQSLIA